MKILITETSPGIGKAITEKILSKWHLYTYRHTGAEFQDLKQTTCIHSLIRTSFLKEISELISDMPKESRSLE
jgi:hypothetical protein